MVAVMNDWIPRHRITVDEYYRMAGGGGLPPDSRVELIEGEIIDMAPIGSQHNSVVARLSSLLHDAIKNSAIVWTQSSVRLSSISEPQPDIAILRPRGDYYSARHPYAEDMLLLIEVSSTTIRYDTQVKVPLYARYGVPEVWVFDLEFG